MNANIVQNNKWKQENEREDMIDSLERLLDKLINGRKIIGEFNWTSKRNNGGLENWYAGHNSD